VFDIEGLWEVVSEISNEFQSDRHKRAQFHPSDAGRVVDEASTVAQMHNTGSVILEADVGAGMSRQVAREEAEIEIGDSEAEEEEGEDLEEVNTPSIQNLSSANNLAESGNIFVDTNNDTRDPVKPAERKGKTEIIIIDNMTTPISTLFLQTEKSSGESSSNQFPPCQLSASKL
jgi:hypothetical protein